jgi:hypothetical protein
MKPTPEPMTPAEVSKTPRTDEQAFDIEGDMAAYHADGRYVVADHARQLETELAAALDREQMLLRGISHPQPEARP